MRLVITLDPGSIEITPVASDGAYDWLLDVGSITMIAYVGQAQNNEDREAASLEVKISNAARQASKVLGLPLRKRAEVFDDDNASFFGGYISDVDYAHDALTLRIGA